MGYGEAYILGSVRRARLWIALALACLFAQMAQAQLPKSELAPSVFIEAESLHRRDGKTIATGNVSVEVQGMRLDCQHLIYDPKKKVITAEGECVLSWGENFATAESLWFDVQTQGAFLQQVAGKSEGLVVGDKEFEGSLYFWAQSMAYTPEKIRLEKAVLTTCDVEPNRLHYQIDAKLIDFFPGDKMVASQAALTMGGHRLYTLPTLMVPLGEYSPRRRGYFPSVGYNNLDGAFIRNSFNYAFNPANYGSLNVDVYGRSGMGYGIEHVLDLGDRGHGNFYFYTQNGHQSKRNRTEIRASGNFRLDRYTNVDLSYNQTEYELPGQVSPYSVAGSLALSRFAPGSSLQVGAIFARSDQNSNRSYRFSYDVDLSDQWSVLTRAEFSSSSTAIDQTRHSYYLGSLRHRNELFEGDLSFEKRGGQDTYFLNRQPELSLRAYPFHVGFLPLTASASFGVLEESPSMFRTERYNFDLKVPDQLIATPLGNIHLGAGMRQSLYGSGQEQYLLGARFGWTQDLFDHLLLRFDYNWQDSKGYTPFQHDLNFGYQVISGGAEVYSDDTFRLSASGAYDLNYSAAFDVITRLDIHPVDGWSLTAAANLDPNTGRWRSVDSGVTAKVTNNLSLTHWSVYDLVNGRLTYQNFSLNYEDHDWIGSLAYRGVQNEIFLQLSLKAFPLRPLKVGPDSSLPILPANINNAFTR